MRTQPHDSTAHVEGADEIAARALPVSDDGALVAARVGVGLELALKRAAHHELKAHKTARATTSL